MSSSVTRIAILLALLLTAFSGMAVHPMPASAETLTVSTCDSRSLLLAVEGATSGSTVNFSCSGVIAITGRIGIYQKEITIDGSGQDVTITGLGRESNVLYGPLIEAVSATVTLKNLTIENSGGLSGHGIDSSSSTLNIINCIFFRNRTGDHGGAILHHDGPLNITNSTFIENLGYHGGAIRSTFADVTITNSTFTGNMAVEYGGAVYVNAGSLNVSNSTFNGNEIDWVGGAGAAIWANTTSDEPATLTNSTITGNKSGHGGAVTTLSDMNVTHSTFYANTTGQFGFGSGLYIQGGTTMMANSIMVNHPRITIEGFGNVNGACANHSTFVDGGGNLADDGGAEFDDQGYCEFPGDGNQFINLDPAGLQFNGGLTKTIALQSISSAKGAAIQNCTPTDQRGAPRPERCDSGAYQSGATPALVDNPTVNTCDESSLRYTIAIASPGSTVLFWCSGTIALTSAGGGAISVSKDLKIDSSSNPVTVTSSESSAFVVTAGSTVTLEDFTIAQSADSAVRNAGTLYVNDMSFTGNSSAGGSSIRNVAGTVQVNNSTFTGSYADGDGGALFNSGTLNIANSIINGNHSTTDSGGGVANYGQLTVASSTFSGNSATEGGAIANYGQADVASSTFSGNSATGSGGGFTNLAQLSVVNSTVSGNSASTSGGGIENLGQLVMVNSTVSGNNAPNALFTAPPDAGVPVSSTLSNTILANPQAGSECIGAVIDGGGNLTTDGSCAFTDASSINSSATLAATLSPLGSYGGPTETIALLDGSPALISGVWDICIASPVGGLDQRGYPRRVPTCASGAFDPSTAPTFVTVVTSPTAPLTGRPTELYAYVNVMQRPDLQFNGGGTINYYMGTTDNPIEGCTELAVWARCIITFPEAGTYTLIATYSGEVRFAASQGIRTVTVTDPVGPVFETTDSSPYTAMAGSAGFMLTVSGNLFTPDSVVHLDGVPLVTYFGSDTQLTADVPANLTAHAAIITVVNPPPGNEVSNPQVLFVTLTGAGMASKPVIASGTNVVATFPERPTHNNHRIITTGTGTVALAEFASNPSGSSSYGTDRYTTAVVLPGSSFSSVIVMNCVLNGGNQLRWWDGTGWVPATPQIRNPIPCQLFTATSTSTPTLAQLDGAPFAVTNSTLEVQVPAAQRVQYGSPFSADVSATGADVGATITLQASGLPAGLTFTDYGDGTGTVSGTVTGDVGPYSASITASDGEGDSASARLVVTVTPAPLTITASNATVIDGDPAPVITPSYAGFVLEESATALTTLPTCGTDYTQGAPVGSYATSCSGAVATNYAIEYQSGTLDVTAVTITDQTITLDLSALDVNYGDSPFDISSYASASSGLPVRFSSVTLDICSVSDSTITLLAAGTCTVAANQAGDDSYNPAPEIRQNFDVAKVNLTVSANDVTITYGDVVPFFDATVTGLVNGDGFAGLGGTCGAEVNGSPVSSSTPAGSYPDVITCSGVDTANYIVAYMPGTLTINQAPTITSENAATFDLDVLSSFSVMADGYPQVTFSTSGPLPEGVTLDPDGTLSGTATEGGTFSFTIVASNGIDPESSQSFTLTVVVPTILPPDDIRVPNDDGYGGAVVAYPAPETIGRVGEVTCTPASESFFNLGDTTVKCVSSLSSATADFTVTVSDAVKPVIVAPADILAFPTSQTGAIVTYTLPTVTDNAPGVSVICTPPSGTLFPVGTTQVTCTATDTSGNTASASFKVQVASVSEMFQELSRRVDTLSVTGGGAKQTALRGVLQGQVSLAKLVYRAHVPLPSCLQLALFDGTLDVQVRRGLVAPHNAEPLYEVTEALRIVLGCGSGMPGR